MTERELMTATLDRLEDLTAERVGPYEGQFERVSFRIWEEGAVDGIDLNGMTVWCSEGGIASPDAGWTPESLANYVLGQAEELGHALVKLGGNQRLEREIRAVHASTVGEARAVLRSDNVHCPNCCDTMSCERCPLRVEEHCGLKARL